MSKKSMSQNTPKENSDDDHFEDLENLENYDEEAEEEPSANCPSIQSREPKKYLAKNITANELLGMSFKNYDEVIVHYPSDTVEENGDAVKPDTLMVSGTKIFPKRRDLPEYKQINFMDGTVMNMFCANCSNCPLYRAKFDVIQGNNCGVSGGRKMSKKRRTTSNKRRTTSNKRRKTRRKRISTKR
jgi:hypothetical protein